MDVPKLTILVQNYPEIYDIRHPEYFNNVRQDNCWGEVGGIMNESGVDFKGHTKEYPKSKHEIHNDWGSAKILTNPGKIGS